MAIGATAALSGFREHFAGRSLVSGDDGYDEARAVWNGEIDRRPALIARCATPADVAAAIGFARQQELELSVRGGGHSYAGTAVADGAVMLDLSPMRAVAVDPAARTVRCGGGASWAEVDAATQAHGLAVTGGYVSHTGVGGLTLGGGVGWLTRKMGLTCDNAVSFQVVTATGEVLSVSAQDHPDLFWALRGGGGNFGVVTSFELALQEVGPMAHLAMWFWALEHGAEALRLARELLDDLPEDLGVFLGGISAPASPVVPDRYHRAPGITMMVVGFADAAELAPVVDRLRQGPAPLFDMETPIPYAQLQQLQDEAQAWGSFAYEKGLYLDDLTDDVIEVVVRHTPGRAAPVTSIGIFPLGGAYARVADDDTAFGGSRSARYMVSLGATCATPELLRADRQWVRTVWDALVPHAAGAGSYVNFMADYDDARVRASYGPEKYDRLAALKARYDPDNVFHLNANIRPAPPGPSPS